jgi:arginine transport system substrate-binding protein
MSRFFKKYWPAIIVLAIIGFITIKFSQHEHKPSSDTLVVGLQSGYPPFEFMDEEGKIVGFDVDVAQRLADRLGKTLVIKDMEFEGEILSLKQGKIDLIISGMNITPSRLKEILMVPYHGEAATSFSLIFWKQIPEGVKSIEDLAKIPSASVSVESGSIPEAYMSQYHATMPLKSFQGSLAPLIDVKYGKSTANLVQPDVADYLKQQHPEIEVLSIPLPEDENILGFGIGIKKGNQELFDQVQQIMQELKASGELKQLEDKWFKGNPS